MNKYILTLILLVSMLISTNCFAQTCTDTKYRYSLELPDEWSLQKPNLDERFNWFFIQRDSAKFRFGFISIHEPNSNELYPASIYDIATVTEQRAFCGDLADGQLDGLKAYYNDPAAVYDSYRYDLPNNIFYVFKIRNIKKYQNVMGDSEGKVIVATTVLNHVAITITMCYGGDTDNAETVFKQILSSIKPL